MLWTGLVKISERLDKFGQMFCGSGWNLSDFCVGVRFGWDLSIIIVGVGDIQIKNQ